MPGELNTYDSLRAAIAANNPTDQQVKDALREILEALTVGGKATPFLRVDFAGAPTDVLVQQADVGGQLEREVYDGMAVAVRSAGGKFQLYIRDAGAWIAVDDA